eukprot:CAMPEP_0195144340 /NCGR_PEP_ID=MMETSP0448-20130528/167879_1 /TAXON_ID=66468 /ORGANISM="Heterocapsa triquestra, Strain CCMP 448" /LENGTH=152 /DNA_ID=CAMNT_0040182809 /DNA_START=8 /DNA_END=463 /DNA_ORIENTATION=+
MGKGSIALEKGSMVEEVQEPVTSFAVRNTFIELCEDVGSEIILARQRSEPAALLKRRMSQATIAEEGVVVSQDPAGPEPEPASKELDVTWERLVTNERWASQPEADQPDVQPEAVAMPMQAAWVAPSGEMDMQWDEASMMMSQAYGMMSWPV